MKLKYGKMLIDNKNDLETHIANFVKNSQKIRIEALMAGNLAQLEEKQRENSEIIQRY